ncbi:hypothetical protein AA313_de0206236 [Arthrobotrys entomopaga]|nr:hypothetical protein AA313_de0206236 [Arthrobotrys entomopaga]
MNSLRTAVTVKAGRVALLRSKSFGARARSFPLVATKFRASISTAPRLLQNTSQSHFDSISNAPHLLSTQKPGPATPQTLTEKIVQRYSVGLAPGKVVKSGDYVTIKPHHCMTHDNSWPVAQKFMAIGASKINDNRQIVITIDHDVTNKSEANLKKYRLIDEFATKQGVDRYGAGRGIGHQIMIEEGYAWPGTLTVASDSHSNVYGGVGVLGTPIVRSDAASVWATSRTWWQVPPVAKVNLVGILPPGVSGKDVIVALCGLINQDEVLNHAIEFTGSEETLRSIPIDHRLTIANMTTEWGALSGVFPVDEMLVSWYRAKATSAARSDSPTKDRINHKRIDELLENPLVADPGATYAKEFYIDISTIAPIVAGPNSVKVATPLKDLEVQDIPINKAYLVSCTNSRASDIAAAARVFRQASNDGKPAQVATGVKLFIAAASIPEQQIAEEAGDWQVLLDAGAEALPSGCAQCIGLGPGLLEPGEVGISASNRNYKGRMGSVEAKAYLASPEVVAASALKGKIAGPGWYHKPEGVEKVIIGEGSGNHIAEKTPSAGDALDKIVNEAKSMSALSESTDEQLSGVTSSSDDSLNDILPGFPEIIEGEIVFCDNENMNTDAIYAGKYTYQNVPRERMAEVCMENYDPEFRTTAKAGDILVSGYNFGCGSSREQAATSILAKGIPLVVAGSFGNIFSRNSINNALLGVELPRLVERLRESYKDDTEKILTRRTGWRFLWDVRRSKVVVTEKDGTTWEQKVGQLAPNVQEIIARGGLESWVKSQISI